MIRQPYLNYYKLLQGLAANWYVHINYKFIIMETQPLCQANCKGVGVQLQIANYINLKFEICNL